MNDPFDFRTLPEDQQLASYGAFFAMANADGVIDGSEVVAIFESLDVSNLSDAGQVTVRNYLVSPPDLETCLSALAGASEELRYGVMLRLVEVADADDVVMPGEELALARGRDLLGVSEEQQQAIRQFLQQVAQVRERGIDDDEAKDSLKSAVATMTALGVPSAAIFFSGGVASLGGAGITAGLTALGLGFGIVPGIGMAMLLGATSLMAASWALGIGKQGDRLRAEEEERGRRLIANLEPTISDLADRVRSLEDTDGPPRELERLRKRLRALQRLLAQARGRK